MLYKQDELRKLEQDLLQLDAADSELDKKVLKSRLRDDMRDGQERKHLIERIDNKLKEYGEPRECQKTAVCVLTALQMTA